jgi:hypothetical protein
MISALRKETARVGTPCLPVDDAAPARRATQLAERRAEYGFECMFRGIPPLMPRLPAGERNIECTKELGSFWGAIGIGAGDVAYQQMANAFDHDADGFERWRKPLAAGRDIGYGVPIIGQEPENRWATDAEFGWQKMNGACPFHLRRCTELPAGFAVTDELLEGLLPPGARLSDLMAAGRVFISDYSDIEHPTLAIHKDVCAAAGWALHWSDLDNALMPLAIQLANDAARSPVFTPLDGTNWLAAKLHAQAAEHSYDVLYHVLACHVMGEALFCSMQRRLHANHPIHVLLAKHFFFNVGVNEGVKHRVFVKGDDSEHYFTVGACREEWMVLHNADWDFNARYNMPEHVRSRGIDSAEVLPGHLWRDDTLALWGAVSKFVSDVLGFWYECDADVAADAELAAWVAELQAPRPTVKNEPLPAGCGCGFKGLPVDADGRMTTVAQVKLLVTMILNNQTVNHSASGNASYEMTAFVPNMPGRFYLPVADLKAAHDSGEQIGMHAITRALPGMAGIGLAVLYSFNHASPKKFPLPSYGHDFFPHEQVRTFLDNFQAALWEIELRQKMRNQRLDEENDGRGGNRGYCHLYPSRIGMSANL